MADFGLAPPDTLSTVIAKSLGVQLVQRASPEGTPTSEKGDWSGFGVGVRAKSSIAPFFTSRLLSPPKMNSTPVPDGVYFPGTGRSFCAHGGTGESLLPGGDNSNPEGCPPYT